MSRPATSPILTVTNLLMQRSGRTVLDVAHLEVHRGETLAVIGPNGAGKSTLLLAMALLLQPNSGTISIGGKLATPANTLHLRRRMAVVFQEPLLLDTSVANNVATGLKLRGIARHEQKERVDTWLARFGIAHLAHRSARSLSGGEAQRTSLARAFALEPEIIFLDEPFSALDAPTRATLTADLSAVLRATETTTILVTHDRDDALTLGDRVGVLLNGRLRQVGPPEAVFSAPADAEVASFVGVETIVPGVVLANEDGLAQVRVSHCLAEAVSDLAPGTPVLLCLRPEDITLHPVSHMTDVARSSARNRLSGRVLSLSPLGGQVRVAVDCGFRLAAAVTRRSAADMGLSEGASVVASFKATSAHLIPRSDSHLDTGI